jgi:hypothetical protein
VSKWIKDATSGVCVEKAANGVARQDVKVLSYSVEK